MRIKYLLAISACVAVSACEASRGGAGQTTRGEPLVAEIWQNENLQQGYTITSINGWSCQGILSKEQRNDITKSVVAVPLTCSNGVTGKSLVSVDRLKGEVDINFRLSNGKVGSVSIE